ncbi:MAG: NfeD family protein [bacterium]
MTGSVAVLAELLIPGGVISFLGLAGILVGLGRYFGLLEGWMTQFTAWFVLSLVLLIGLRGLFMRLMPGSTTYGSIDEDAAMLGMEVEVVETVHPDNADGRIRHQGTTWAATSMEGTIPAGAKARIAYRESTTWVIESIEPSVP